MRLCECGKPVMLIDTIYSGVRESEHCADCELERWERAPSCDGPITFAESERKAQIQKYGVKYA